MSQNKTPFNDSVFIPAAVEEYIVQVQCEPTLPLFFRNTFYNNELQVMILTNYLP